MSQPLVSIVLVTRNGATTLPATLEAIARQRVDWPVEIVAVDSGSTDGTLALLEGVARHVVRIPPAAFNHGLTRNLAIEQARGELVVLLVQDALPASDDWLERLTAPLRGDRYVAGAFCRQQPRPTATALTRLYQREDRWIAFSETSRRVRLRSLDEYERLTSIERLRLCAFDNVCSCIRRSVWQQIPFADTPIAEDLEWGRAALLMGYGLHYVADAVVLHSHERPARYEFARTYALHRQLYHLFGVRTIPSARMLARAIASSAREHLVCERRAARAGERTTGLARALALAIAWPLGQYLGALSVAQGWAPLELERV